MRGLGSLRARIVLLVLLGADLPLALTGWWLSRSAVRSAERLLEAQLDTSVTAIAARVEEAWAYRRGDLLYLAENDVILRALTQPGHETRDDSVFLTRLCDAMRPTLSSAVVLSRSGAPVWTCSTAGSSRDASFLPASMRAASRGDDRITTRIAIKGSDSAEVGALEASVQLGALLRRDSLPVLVRGAELSVVERGTGRLVSPSDGEAVGAGARIFRRGAEDWIAAHRQLDDPPLILTVAAPMQGFVQPFVEAATVGWLVFAAITLITLVVATIATRRLTGSLERLVVAADAVAAGDLERNVDTDGAAEVGRLGSAFNTMTESLRTTLQRLSQQQAMVAVGEFASSLSHEVRNALTAVRLDLQRVEERVPGDDTNRELVTRALANVRRLDTVVSGSLAVARGGRIAFTDIDLNTLLTTAAQTVRSTYDETGASLEWSPPRGDAMIVRGDAAALEQLFVNLLQNAAQAMRAGGRAVVTVEAGPERYAVLIRDTGPGMTAEQLAHVGHPLRSTKRGGTGIGLAIASRIASAHGGTLSLESPSSGGLIARVELPRRG